MNICVGYAVSVTRHNLLGPNLAPLVWQQCSIYRWRFKSVCKLFLRRW